MKQGINQLKADLYTVFENIDVMYRKVEDIIKQLNELENKYEFLNSELNIEGFIGKNMAIEDNDEEDNFIEHTNEMLNNVWKIQP